MDQSIKCRNARYVDKFAIIGLTTDHIIDFARISDVVKAGDDLLIIKYDLIQVKDSVSVIQ